MDIEELHKRAMEDAKEVAQMRDIPLGKPVNYISELRWVEREYWDPTKCITEPIETRHKVERILQFRPDKDHEWRDVPIVSEDKPKESMSYMMEAKREWLALKQRMR